MHVEQTLAALGFALPDLESEYRRNASGAHFVSHRAVGDLLYLSGTVPVRDGRPHLPGVVGRDLTTAQGYEAARWAVPPALAIVRYALGDLDRVEEAVHLVGYVNSAPGFTDQPRVVNGATDLLVALYGERGKPTRAAIGCQGLAFGSSVEIVLTLRFAGREVRPPLARDAREG
jgi:enamine deaminase RidA (YjgF/YER057c/UK114 family)